MRLNPHYPAPYILHLGHSYFILQQQQEAEAAFLEAIARAPEFPVPRLFMAALCVESNQQKRANQDVALLLQGAPNASVAWASVVFPYRSTSDLDRFLTGLINAGLPE